jgi:HlyD family secretion protein
MRTAIALAIGIVALSAWHGTSPDRGNLPTVASDTVVIREVVRHRLGPNTLSVDRPPYSRAMADGSLFVVNADGVAHRVRVRYGRVAGPMIEIISGLSFGDRVIVSDMSAFDQFERLRIKTF